MARIDPSVWMVLLIVLPLASAILSYVVSRAARWIGVATALVMTIPVAGLAHSVWHTGVLSHKIGGWGAPLGIELAADGLSVLMLTLSTIVCGVGSVYAFAYFAPRSRGGEKTGPALLAIVDASMGRAQRAVSLRGPLQPVRYT
jgi:multicomponent Na+:H+ antiporter subunit D